MTINKRVVGVATLASVLSQAWHELAVALLFTCVLPIATAGAEDVPVGTANGASTPETSQPPQSNASEIQDIIVTAERRSQSVQKAPLTIEVLDASQVLQSGLSTATDLDKLTSGVEIGAGGANTQIFIRGVGGFSFSPISSPGVAFNVDGIYVGRPDGVNGNFYDVDRVEILKGPQGTLYGRNANGGSINLITNDAALNQEGGDLNVETGDYNLVHTSGAINIPMGTTAALRGAFNVVNREGYLSNGADDDVEQSGRLRFIWQPSDDITLHASGDYSHIGGKGGDYVYVPQRPGASPWEAETDPAENAYLHAFSPTGPLVDNLADDSKQDLRLFDFSAQLDWQFADFATLTILPAFRHMDADYVTHFDETYSANESSHQESLETRLGNSGEALTWVAGIYYFQESSPNSTTHVDASNILQNVLLDYSPNTKAYAGFGQTTVRVIDSFRLIAGVRYTEEIQSLSGTYDSAITDPPTLLENFGGKKKFDGLTYKAGAEYDVTDQSMLYLTYSTGYKAGGFNQTIAPNTYNPEKLGSYEIGSRNRFFDNRLQLNVGAFRWHYTDIQDQRVNFDPDNNVNFITFNSGDAILYGANWDVIAKPAASDTVRLSGEFDQSHYSSFFYQVPVPFYQPGSSGCRQTGPYPPGATLPYAQQTGGNTNQGPLPVFVENCSGFQVARVPKWSANLSYAHDFAVANQGTLTLEGAAKFESASWLNVDFIAAERQHAYEVFDADLTYTPASSRWSVTGYGRNLADKAYYTGGIASAFVGGLFNGNIAPPRTYGVRASLKFGN